MASNLLGVCVKRSIFILIIFWELTYKWKSKLPVDFGLISVSDVAVACRSYKAWRSWCWTIILDRLFHFIIRVVPGIYMHKKSRKTFDM